MSDRYLGFANSNLGRRLVDALGLPRPAPLERWQAGRLRPVEGALVLGGGPLASQVEAIAPRLTDTLYSFNTDNLQAEAWVAGLGPKIKAVVFDASHLSDSDALKQLREFFQPLLRSLAPCAHVVVLGRAPESLDDPLASIVQRALEGFSRSLANARFASSGALVAAAEAIDPDLTAEEKEALAAATYTGWSWTTDNFRRLSSSRDTTRVFFNTLFFVAMTLVFFNIGYAMFLAIATHYMPERPAGIFRIIWFLPRISPVVIYVLLWKWVAWDTGFLNAVLSDFGVRPRNWMLDSATQAWFFVIMINGFVGASMGMLIFASAIKAIPETHFHAASVDGAYRWQQIRHIILPQLKWPILFVTCYQTLSLLTSIEQTLLATDGGPGGATEIWSLWIYHTALNNYAGNLQYGYGAAMALVLVVIGIVLSLIYLRLFNYNALITRPRIEL